MCACVFFVKYLSIKEKYYFSNILVRSRSGIAIAWPDSHLCSCRRVIFVHPNYTKVVFTFYLRIHILNTRYLFYFSDPRSKVKDAANQGCNTAEDGQDAGVQLLLRTRRVSRVSPQLPGLAAAAENCTETCPRQLHLKRLLLS